MNNESKHFIENLHKAAEHNESAQFHVVSMSSSFDQTLTFFKTIKTFIQNKKNTFVSLFNFAATYVKSCCASSSLLEKSHDALVTGLISMFVLEISSCKKNKSTHTHKNTSCRQLCFVLLLFCFFQIFICSVECKEM